MTKDESDSIPPAPPARLTVEERLGVWILSARWLQLPMLVGLIAALALFEAVFFAYFGRSLLEGKATVRSGAILLVLDLVDMVLIANLMVMVFVSGYKIFITRVDLARHPGLPKWMADLTLAGVKYRISATVLLISTIHLLHELLDTSITSWEGGLLLLAVQIVLIATTVAFAVIERWEKD